MRNDPLSRVMVALTVLLFRDEFDVENQVFVIKAHLSSVFLVIVGRKKLAGKLGWGSRCE